ncbi:DUF2007 domain-containing protein [bacterium]|nr:DUF2007 domain-containing protein [bacterium]
MLNGYVEIEVFDNDLNAEIAKGILAENGVEAMIGKDDCGGMLPNLQVTQGVRLYVLPRDVEKSERLLKPITADQSAENAEAVLMWRCSNCGEILEPQFTSCWKCGADRDRSSV